MADCAAAADRPGLCQHIIDHLERQVLRQLAQMAGSKNADGDSDLMTDGRGGRLSTQRDLWCPGTIVVIAAGLPEVLFSLPATHRTMRSSLTQPADP